MADLDKLHELLDQTLNDILNGHSEGLAKAKDMFDGNHAELSTKGKVQRGPLTGCTVKVSVIVNPEEDGESE